MIQLSSEKTRWSTNLTTEEQMIETIESELSDLFTMVRILEQRSLPKFSPFVAYSTKPAIAACGSKLIMSFL